ncbi:unnamed protein product [Heterobilharzia americana]|nr:unnamed protein product [Heterobilharzia americana]
MEFNRKSIRQIGYYTPTYSNSPNVKRHKDKTFVSYHQSELYGLNLSQLNIAQDLKSCSYSNSSKTTSMDMEQKLKWNDAQNNHIRIIHTLDGKKQIICDTPSRTRQYWLDRRKLASPNHINENNIVNYNKQQLYKTTYASRSKTSASSDQFQLAGTTTIITPKYQMCSRERENKSENWNIEEAYADKKKDMQLFELTENEFILSELDPRLNLNSVINDSGITVIDSKKYLNYDNLVEKEDGIPVYQPIEETYKVDLSPPNISKYDHRQVEQFTVSQYHCNSSQQLDICDQSKDHCPGKRNLLSTSSASTLRRQKHQQEFSLKNNLNNQTEICINVNHKSNASTLNDHNTIKTKQIAKDIIICSHKQFSLKGKTDLLNEHVDQLNKQRSVHLSGVDTQPTDKITLKISDSTARQDKDSDEKNDRKLESVQTRRYSALFSHKQEIIIMPNNNNNNNNNERSENVSLPRSVTTTGQQQQQLTRLSVKDKSNSLNVHFQQHTLSSGNTTRSAPSPSLSSITSTHGVLSSPVYQEQINQRLHQYKPGTLKTSSASSITLTGPIRISKGYSMHKQQTMSGGHMYHLNSDDYSIPIQYQDILSASRINPHPALDPILARLLSDVTSIDEYRSTLQPHGSVTPPSSLANQRRNANQLHIPLASSDPESISRSAERLSGINLSAQQNIMDDVWDLNKQIGDLIQMEFDYRQKQPTTLKSQSPHGTLISGISTIGPRSSAPNVRVEEKAINDDDDIIIIIIKIDNKLMELFKL